MREFLEARGEQTRAAAQQWTGERLDDLMDRAMIRGQHRRRRRRALTVAGSTLAVAVVALVWLQGSAPEDAASARDDLQALAQPAAQDSRASTPVPVERVDEDEELIVLTDDTDEAQPKAVALGGGNRAELLVADSRLVPESTEGSTQDSTAIEAGGQRVRLESGAARFEARDLTVMAQGASIRGELGVFVVRFVSAGLVVEVDSGVVTVERREFHRRLQAGDRLELSAAQFAEAPGNGRSRTSTAESVPKSAPGWRALARSGAAGAAYDALVAAGEPTDVEGLVLAADIVRRAGHADQAPRYLQAVIDDHRSDPMASVAAFALGRVYLESLQSPAKAADAFATARALAPRGPLAEDALARQVEALTRAGDVDGARVKAEEYFRRYPSGRHREQIRRHVPTAEF